MEWGAIVTFPPPTAQAIAERMLVALVQAEAESWALDGAGGDVWVREQANWSGRVQQ